MRRGLLDTHKRSKYTRDIEIVARDRKHVIERAGCTACGIQAWASDGAIPRQGAHGANLESFVALLRENGVKFHAIAEILRELAGRDVISKATAIEINGRVSDMHRGESEAILLNIEGPRWAAGRDGRAGNVHQAHRTGLHTIVPDISY